MFRKHLLNIHCSQQQLCITTTITLDQLTSTSREVVGNNKVAEESAQLAGSYEHLQVPYPKPAGASATQPPEGLAGRPFCCPPLHLFQSVSQPLRQLQPPRSGELLIPLVCIGDPVSLQLNEEVVHPEVESNRGSPPSETVARIVLRVQADPPDQLLHLRHKHSMCHWHNLAP